RQTGRLVLLGDRDDQAQVRLHERALGLFALGDRAAKLALLAGRDAGRLLQFAPGGVAAFDGLGQANLVILREQGILSDVSEVEPDEILLVPLNSFLGHGVPFPGFAWSARGLGFATQHPTPPCSLRYRAGQDSRIDPPNSSQISHSRPGDSASPGDEASARR